MTLDSLAAEVCAYTNRRRSDFVMNGVDLIVNALNKARRSAQKLVDFELLRCPVTVAVPLTGEVSLSTASWTPLNGSAQTVRINRIERAYMTLDSKLRPIDFLSRSTVASRDQRIYDNNLMEAILSRADLPTVSSRFPVFVRRANEGYLWPSSSPMYQNDPETITLDVVRWADDYTSSQTPINVNLLTSGGPLPVGTTPFYARGTFNSAALYATLESSSVRAVIYFDSTALRWKIADTLDAAQYWQSTTTGISALQAFTFEAVGFANAGAPTNSSTTVSLAGDDFFMTDCEEWLFAAVCRQLQYYLKQDERTMISLKQLDEAWQGVVAWNNSIAESASAQEYTLD